MITRNRRASSFLFICVLLLLKVEGYTPEAEKFDAPSLSIRGALKAALDHDYEDVIVMQTEMAWGAQEMKRYKAHKGEWPVRSALKDDNELGGGGGGGGGTSSSAVGGVPGFFRGTESPPTNEEGEIDYWAYLVSIF
ncbi:expressed unknown protein [Seminavis robusta]|uniref:Uncharacterized protein n=1 Tax=Seminavis robusta TaxID=568900 RepID=A0A9N8E1U7_9STRA|nr:expressed unknown protein [Seminavis robusta]|eukprot:Sro567_g167930.1 n/a (137) ;mRNA; r:17302-17712